MPKSKFSQPNPVHDLEKIAYRELTNKKNLKRDLDFARLHPVIASIAIIAIIGIGVWYYSSAANSPAPQPSVAGANSKEEGIRNGSATLTILPSTTESRILPANKYPDPTKTPGAIYQNITAVDVCDSGYAQRVRNVPSLQKKQVYESYGMSYPQPAGAYEVDHFIPLSIGGSNDSKNLWPEPASPTPGFHEKDKVEFYLYNAVCSGKISLKDAQDSMKNDWYKVYQSLPSTLNGTDPDGGDGN
jgi:hypothetical protein